MVPGALKEEHHIISPSSSHPAVPNWFGEVELNALFVPRYKIKRNPGNPEFTTGFLFNKGKW